jgi:hypothetical protein
MWNRDRSVLLSIVATRLLAGLAIALAIALPFLISTGFFADRATIASENAIFLLPIYYSFCVPVGIALFSLDRLLSATRQDLVFTAANVRRLRIISWCCFGAGVILLVSSLVSVVFFALAILAAFFGVILRTMKNLFATAVALQDESNLTI